MIETAKAPVRKHGGFLRSGLAVVPEGHRDVAPCGLNALRQALRTWRPKPEMVTSPQTLSKSDRRLLAGWAALCAERVLFHVKNEPASIGRASAAIARAWAFSRNELDTTEAIRLRFGSGRVPREILSPPAIAASRAAGQASAVCHMGAHALGAAGYAVMARVSSAASIDTGPAEHDRAAIIEREIAWQLARLSPVMRAALGSLPPLGMNGSGPLGPGLLSRGQLGAIIAKIQSRLTNDRPPSPTRP